MRCRIARVSVAIVGLAGLLLFSAFAPLAHLHPESPAPTHRHHGETPPGVTFHAHLDGHSHDADPEELPERDDSLRISHGRVDSPRSERLSKPLVELAAAPELAPPSRPGPEIAGPPPDVYRPPPLLFATPSRAPPSLG